MSDLSHWRGERPTRQAPHAAVALMYVPLREFLAFQKCLFGSRMAEKSALDPKSCSNQTLELAGIDRSELR